MSEAPPPVASPGLRPRVTWGIGDFLLVLLAQFTAAIVAELAYRGVAGVPLEEALSDSVIFGVLVPARSLAVVGALVAIVRAKGGGSLARDLGFEIRFADWTALLAGMGWQVLFNLLLIPFVLLLEADEPAQDLVQSLGDVGGLDWLVIVIGIVVVAPILEELLFRGLLLRALLRRTTPLRALMISSWTFGLVHLTGISWGLEAIPAVLALSILGAVLGAQALRTGSLSRPILTHMGFNVLVVAAQMVV